MQSAFRGFFVFAVDKKPIRRTNAEIILGRPMAFILFATLVGVMEQKKKMPESRHPMAARTRHRQREESCASHIGKLTGAKHDAALKWLWPFTFAGKEHRMTEKDYQTCPAF